MTEGKTLLIWKRIIKHYTEDVIFKNFNNKNKILKKNSKSCQNTQIFVLKVCLLLKYQISGVSHKKSENSFQKSPKNKEAMLTEHFSLVSVPCKKIFPDQFLHLKHELAHNMNKTVLKSFKIHNY